MLAAFNRCHDLIKAGRTQGMAEKLAALLSFDLITIEEYNSLMQQLQAATAM